MELASILRSIVVGMADKRSLPVSLEFVPGDGDTIRGVCNI